MFGNQTNNSDNGTTALTGTVRWQEMRHMWTILSILIISSNFFALLTLTKCKRMALQIRIFAINLTITDLSTGLVLLVDSIVEYIQSGGFPISWCRTRGILYSTMINSSIFTVAVLSFDRCFSLYYSIRYQYIVTGTKVRVACVLIWVVGLISGVCTYIQGILKYPDAKSACNFLIITEVSGRIIILFVTVIPLTLIVSAYIAILVKIKQTYTSVTDAQYMMKTFILKQQFRSTIKILVIAGVFILLYVPFSVCTTMILAKADVNLAEFLRYSHILILSNSFTNPFLYAWRFRECRINFCIMVCYCNKNLRQKLQTKRKQFVRSFLGTPKETQSTSRHTEVTHI